MQQRDLGAVLDIALSCRDIADFLEGLCVDQFLDDKRTQSAVIHQIMVIGEAVKRLSREFRSEITEVPWTAIAGMRDSLIHGYDEVDVKKVWQVATTEVPDLLILLEPLLPPGE